MFLPEIQLTTPDPATLKPVELVFYQAEYDCFPRGTDQYCFRRFYRICDLEPMWSARMMRAGAKWQDDVSLCYSGQDNVISAFIKSQGTLIEFDADSDMGRNLMWGFGITLSQDIKDM